MTHRVLWGLVLLLSATVAQLGCDWCDKVALAPEVHPSPPPKPAPCGLFGETDTQAALPTGDMDCGGVVSVRKSAPKRVYVGQDFEYHITVTNLTRKPIADVVLTEKFTDNFQISSSNPKASTNGPTAVWSIGELEAQASQTIIVHGSARSAGSINGCSNVTYRNPEVCLAVEAVQPMLKVSKTAPDEVLACDTITYRIVVSNEGDGPACNVTVRDELPEGLTTGEGEKVATFNAGNLNPGESREFILQARTDKTGRYANHATATAEGGLSARSEQVVTMVRKPVLVVSKTGPDRRFVGLAATYEITVTNKGDGIARDTVLEDAIPPGSHVVTATESARTDGAKVMWDLGALEPGQSRKVDITLRHDNVGSVRNTATATAYCARGSAETVTEITGIPAILLECVDLTDPVAVGTQTTYEVIVTNQGSAVATGIVISATLPKEQEFISASGPTKETAAGKAISFAPLKSLAPKAKATYRVTVKAIGSGDVRFGVKLTSDQMDSPAIETESTNLYSD